MILETIQLSKRYGKRIGVESLNLEIHEGDLFGFLGPNGSGKTTTIRLLMGFLRPTSGKARILGFDCWRDSPRVKAETGYLPGDLRLYPWLTGRIAADRFGRMHGRSLQKEYRELACLFDFDLDLPVRRMSKGTRQKLGLTMALAHRPRLLILDEPTTALDPLIQIVLYQRLHSLAEEGCTIFFSSHSLGEVEDLCDRAAILRDGRVVACERIADLRTRTHRRVKILWRSEEDAACISPPAFLILDTRKGLEWEASLSGNAMDLARWCTAYPILDFSVAPPDLSQVFQSYYLKESVPGSCGESC